jgi:hypothetical protein
LTPLAPTEGQALSSVMLFHFSDADPNGTASDYKATVTWGDGAVEDSVHNAATVQVVAHSGGGFDVVGSHTYQEEATGLSFQVQVQDLGGAATISASTAINVADAALSGQSMTVSAIAGAPFSGTVMTFTDLGGAEANDGSHYSVTLNWGDQTPTTMGTLTFSGGVFTVSGNHTYAAAGPYTLTGTLNHEGVLTTVLSPVTVTNLGQGVQVGQSASILFWNGSRGQALIMSFNGGSGATGLANWLALTFPNLYGVQAGSHNLFGDSNLQVAAFYQSLVSTNVLDADVLATALNVYATTQALGGSAGQAYGFRVTAAGLGADWVNVLGNGAAFGVANYTTLNVYQLLLVANQRAVNGLLYGGDMMLRQQAQLVFDMLNYAGGVG